jgi:hypothetical protein
MAAALVMGLGAAATAGQPDGDSKSSPPGLLSNLFADKSKSKTKAGADKAALVEEKPAEANTVETLAAEQQKQMNAILRRMEVCDRLRMVALQTNNEELMRQADELEARAREIYRRHTAQLPISAQSLETPAQTTDKAPSRRESARGNAARNTDLDALPPTPPRRPMSGLKPLGGDFESRERDILNGTSMGRDRP